jgi:hypothetical protein
VQILGGNGNRLAQNQIFNTAACVRVDHSVKLGA